MSIRGVLFIVITLAVFLFTFKKPKIGMFYFLCLLFLRDGYLMENIPEVYLDWHMPLVSGWVVFIAWFFNSLLKKEKMQKPFELIVMFFLGAVILISKRGAYFPEDTMNVFSEYIRMIMLVFLIVNIVKTERDLKQLTGVLVSLTAFLVIYAYYRYKTEGFDIAVPSLYYVDRNFFAESIVVILPFAFVFYEESLNKIKKFSFLIIAALMIMGVILTYSRGGFLALMIVLFFLFIASKKKITMVIVGVIVLALFLPHIGEKYKTRMSTVKTYEEDSSAMARIGTWKAGLNMIMNNPLFGVGAGNFNGVFAYYVSPEFKNIADEEGISIHNMFLQIFSETGLFGGCLFVLIIVSSFMGLFRLRSKNKALPLNKRINLAVPNAAGISLLGFCGAGFFLPGAYYSYIYIIFALIMSVGIVYSGQISKIKAVKL